MSESKCYECNSLVEISHKFCEKCGAAITALHNGDTEEKISSPEVERLEEELRLAKQRLEEELRLAKQRFEEEQRIATEKQEIHSLFAAANKRIKNAKQELKNAEWALRVLKNTHPREFWSSGSDSRTYSGEQK